MGSFPTLVRRGSPGRYYSLGYYSILQTVNNLCEKVSQTKFEETLRQDSCQHILTQFNQYLIFLRKDNGPLSAFWMSYIGMVEILLCLIRASREGNWMMHLAAIRAIIPWFFAYDKLNYARYLTYYYAQMSRLETDHPAGDPASMHTLQRVFFLSSSEGTIPLERFQLIRQLRRP